MSSDSSPATAQKPTVTVDSDTISNPASGFRKGSAFWLTFIAILVCSFVSALDLTAISIALRTITDSLNGGDKFVWVGSAYGLASAASLPLSGRLADTFGRRPVMLASVGLFFLGSALSGASQSMDMLIGARIQGIGSGGILNLSEIIVSDLVPLLERGMFMGIISGVWDWPPDYLNLPLTGIAFVLVLLFLRVRMPPGTIGDKLAHLDTIGNLIIIAGTTVALIGLTWGGVAYKWTSPHTLATLVIGFVFIGMFFVYERLVPNEPSIPWEVVSDRTTLAAYAQYPIYQNRELNILQVHRNILPRPNEYRRVLLVGALPHSGPALSFCL
ncbi:major facilitator superfamily domain-containing protein [Dichomitus squalens]|uniref:Major facilitator superfamily domain-containing protein n=1 Tax=Dichomitus squalens TaxID=114155 RepID=A0A4Q9MLQ5_9APHY|nr:major facilitator superfamily domain-containing protein [Dichomitus squalens]